jgi:hypothetical protein
MNMLPILLLAATLNAGAATAPDHASRVDYLRTGLDKTLTSLEAKTGRSGVSITTRDLTNGALAAVLLHNDGKRAAELLKLAFDTQDMDPQSKNFGMLPWETSNLQISDMNAIEFGTQSMGPILLRYKDKLPAGFQDAMLPHLRAAFVALDKHQVKVSYTNIFLMKTINMILIAEALRDKDTEAKGRKQFDEWVDYTRHAGIHEFDSPTYYSVDLNSLYMGYLYSTDPQLRARFKSALDYFWTDMCANFFSGRDKVAGPYSRDYDFLTGHGGLQIQTWLDGLSSTPSPQNIDLEKVYMLLNELDHGYHPGPEITALIHKADRVVESKYDLEPNRDRYHFLTRDFSAGSASGEYNAQDKYLNIELASSKDLADITVVPDKQDNPYGKVKSKDRSGHSKPTHIAPHATSVQDRGLVLTLLDLDASREGELASLTTDLVLPANADSISLDGHAIDAKSPFKKDATAKSVIAIREGNAIVVLRIFEADAASADHATFVLQADKDGLKYDALRYTAYHYQGPAQKLANKHVRAGILAYAATCTSDKQCAEIVDRVKSAHIESHGDGHIWSVKAKVGNTELAAARDLDRRAILSRQVNGKPFAVQYPLSINGKPVELQ